MPFYPVLSGLHIQLNIAQVEYNIKGPTNTLANNIPKVVDVAPSNNTAQV
jgi:hypothetical protein